MARPIDVGALLAGIAARDRASVARAITLVESANDAHRVAARQLLTSLTAPGGRAASEVSTRPRSSLAQPARPPAPAGGRAASEASVPGVGGRAASEASVSRPTIRLGISGVPGVGKSTFIEALGVDLTAAGHRVGVLAVDPSSVRTGGSVLGDKTRMARLAADPAAFVRPSPASGTLGGVARATSQALVVLEAAAYDVVLVETVGVGQSEITVAGMVDTFCFLTLARTGDQLQGIKKGILEIVDVVAVNKADADRAIEARSAARELAGALRLVQGGRAGWVPPVLTCSALEGSGVDEVWEQVLAHRAHLGESGLTAKRATQQLEFTWALVRDQLDQRLRRSSGVREVRDEVSASVLAGHLPAAIAADRILAAYDAE